MREDDPEADDIRAAMRMVGILLLKLGGSVTIHPDELERLDNFVLVTDDFDFGRALRLRLVPKGPRTLGEVLDALSQATTPGEILSVLAEAGADGPVSHGPVVRPPGDGGPGGGGPDSEGDP